MFAFHRGVLSALAASVLFATAAYAQSPSAQTVTVTADKAPIPVGDFFRHASFGGASMSPDGRHVAMTIADDRGILNLVLLPLDTRVPKILVHAASDVAEIRWVNDKRIAFSFVDRKVGLGDRMMGPGLYAINIDGTGLLELATRNPNILSVGAARQNVLGWRTAMLAHPGKQDSDFIYVTHVTDNGTREAVLDLLKLDTVTGVSTKVARPGRTVDWMLDEEGEPVRYKARDGLPNHPGLADPAASSEAGACKRTCRWWCWCTAARICARQSADGAGAGYARNFNPQQFLASRGYAVLEPESAAAPASAPGTSSRASSNGA
jgi:hypothetical protein